MSARNPLGNLDVNDGQMFYFTTPLQARGNKRTMEGRSSTAAESLKNTGRWTEWEKLAFLKGLRLHGRGNWKKISSMIPTRYVHDTRQHSPTALHQATITLPRWIASAVILLTKFLPNLFFDIRNTIQIKTHAQVLLKKYDEGEYIYDELDRHYQSRRQEVMVPAPIRTRDFDNRLSAMRLFPHPDEATAAFAMLVLSRGEDVN